MIAVDTNVVVRLLTGDDKQQFDKAPRLFEKQDVFIPDSVILEMEWVPRYAYGFMPDAICDAYDKLFGLTQRTYGQSGFDFSGHPVA
uniref:PIN domain-containing protein n=1 Tax=Candidatus Kentrum sp. FW TaxID=2126338 RepID=A0A450U4K0_9GAMM|nr:MAG: PIN domain-containing protein [Candidatus Kentron sp. FW]